MILAVLELAPAAAHHVHGRHVGAAWAAAIVVMIAALVLWAIVDMASGSRGAADGDEP